jgi:hypothetical protein
MADSKISALTALTGANLVAADIFPVVDVSATTAGSKSMLASEVVIGLSSLGLVTGPASATDNAIVRFDGTTGKLVQTSAVTIADTTGAMTIAGGTATASTPLLVLTQTWNNAGVTFQGMTFNVTNTTSNIASQFADFQVGGVSQIQLRRDGQVWSGAGLGRFNGLDINFGGYGGLNWYTGGAFSVVGVSLVATVAQLAIQGASGSAGACLQFTEMTSPAAPATNNVVIFAEDSGGGKTRLMARFATGATQQLAIEP